MANKPKDKVSTRTLSGYKCTHGQYVTGLYDNEADALRDIIRHIEQERENTEKYITGLQAILDENKIDY